MLGEKGIFLCLPYHSITSLEMELPDSNDLTHEVALTLSNSFDLKRDAHLSLDEVRLYLIGHIAKLLHQNPSMLMSILYRIDVAERKVQTVFRESLPGEIPSHLADLIIERQLQKVRYRRQYRDANE